VCWFQEPETHLTASLRPKNSSKLVTLLHRCRALQVLRRLARPMVLLPCIFSWSCSSLDSAVPLLSNEESLASSNIRLPLSVDSTVLRWRLLGLYSKSAEICFPLVSCILLRHLPVRRRSCASRRRTCRCRTTGSGGDWNPYLLMTPCADIVSVLSR